MRLWLKVVAWNCALLALLVIACELIFGGWFEAVGNPALWRLSIYRNVTWHLSAAERYGRAEPVIYSRDAYGFRGKYGQPKDIDILVLGGSTTDERFVSEGETWVDVAGDCLAKAGHPLHLANAGVAGQSSRGHIRNFDAWFPFVDGLKPKAVLVYLGINENVLSGREAEDDVLNYNESTRPAWVERLKLKSALYSLYNTVRGNVLAWKAGLHTERVASDGQLASQAIDAQWRSVSRASVDVESDRYRQMLEQYNKKRETDVSAYRIRLKNLVERIRAIGAVPILATQDGGSYRRQGASVAGDLDAYFSMAVINDVTRAECRDEGLRCIDVARQAEFADGDFWDGVHTTPSGSRRVGELMCRGLLTWAPDFAGGGTR